MEQKIKANAELFKRNGQWGLVLYAPDWVISDLMRTMGQQTNPQILVYASAEYSCDVHGWTYIYFTTWGGGPIGSEVTNEQKQIILKDIK